MKRSIFWSIASVLTFVFGTAVVFTISAISSPITQERQLPPVEKEPTVAKVDDFVPEFRDLPNYDEIEYPKYNTNLIDIFQIGSIYRESEVVAKTGETWLTLFEHNGNYLLRHAKAKVNRLKTTSYVGDEFDVRLSFDKPGIPQFTVPNIRIIRVQIEKRQQ